VRFSSASSSIRSGAVRRRRNWFSQILRKMVNSQLFTLASARKPSIARRARRHENRRRAHRVYAESSVHDRSRGGREDFMRKTIESRSDIRPGVQLCVDERGHSGQTLRRVSEGTNIVLLKPDVAEAFPTEDAVNEALRGILSRTRAVEGLAVFRIAPYNGFQVPRNAVVAAGDDFFPISPDRRATHNDCSTISAQAHGSSGDENWVSRVDCRCYVDSVGWSS
jgi:hypothetical protein